MSILDKSLVSILTLPAGVRVSSLFSLVKGQLASSCSYEKVNTRVDTPSLAHGSSSMSTSIVRLNRLVYIRLGVAC
jgi:hypothetical protein